MSENKNTITDFNGVELNLGDNVVYAMQSKLRKAVFVGVSERNDWFTRLCREREASYMWNSYWENYGLPDESEVNRWYRVREEDTGRIRKMSNSNLLIKV